MAYDLTFKNIDDLCPKQEIEKSKHVLVPRQPCRIALLGHSGSGKTNMGILLITRDLIVDKLYVCSKHLFQPKMEFLMKHYNMIEEKINKKLQKRHKGAGYAEHYKIIEAWTNDLDEMPSVDELDGSLHNIILFDDMMMEKDQKKIVDYFIRGRHKKCTVMYLSQSFFAIPRKIRLNCSHYAMFNSPSKSESKRISNEIAPDLEQKQFLKYLNRATEDDYNFLFIDTTQKKKLLRYRKNLDEMVVGDD